MNVKFNTQERSVIVALKDMKGKTANYRVLVNRF